MQPAAHKISNALIVLIPSMQAYNLMICCWHVGNREASFWFANWKMKIRFKANVTTFLFGKFVNLYFHYYWPPPTLFGLIYPCLNLRSDLIYLPAFLGMLSLSVSVICTPWLSRDPYSIFIQSAILAFLVSLIIVLILRRAFTMYLCSFSVILNMYRCRSVITTWL